MNEVNSPPTVDQVATDLKGLRRGVGLTVERLDDKAHLLRLPAVLADAEQEGRQDDLSAVAYSLLICVLRNSTVVERPAREFVAIELNLEAVSDVYEDRKVEVYNRLVGGRDYRRMEREAYDKVAHALTMLDRSPCNPSPSVAQAEGRYRSLREAMKDHSQQAIAHLLELYGGADRLEDIEDISRRLYEALPGARAELRRIGWEPARPVTFRQVLEHLVKSVLTGPFDEWRAAYPDDVMTGGQLRVALGLEDSALATSREEVALRSDSRYDASVRLLGFVLGQVEQRGEWPRVLAPSSASEAVAVEA